MHFSNALQDTASNVNTLLDQLIGTRYAATPRLLEAMRYATLDQGKRLRPFLVLQSAHLFGGDAESALRTAAALECVHCYSLVHDDLPALDNDVIRRGKPTCHIYFDEATAILTGNALLTVAFEILANARTHQDASVRAELAHRLSTAAGYNGMVGGQMLDMTVADFGEVDSNSVVQLQKMKTGALIAFACEAGPIIAKAGESARSLMNGYAANIGLAYQIADDILDVVSTPQRLGKSTQKDNQQSKATFVDLYGLDGAKAKSEELVAAALATLDGFGTEAELLREAALFVTNREH